MAWPPIRPPWRETRPFRSPRRKTKRSCVCEAFAAVCARPGCCAGVDKHHNCCSPECSRLMARMRAQSRPCGYCKTDLAGYPVRAQYCSSACRVSAWKADVGNVSTVRFDGDNTTDVV